VEVRISLVGGGLAELESLSHWLRGEPEMAGRVRLSGPPLQAGELGAVSEVLVVALGSGGAATAVIAALAGSLKVWLSHPRRPEIAIKIHRPDGNSVEITAKDLRAGDIELEAVVRQVLDFGTGHAVGAAAPEE
jgi:hypothetical protein